MAREARPSFSLQHPSRSSPSPPLPHEPQTQRRPDLAVSQTGVVLVGVYRTSFSSNPRGPVILELPEVGGLERTRPRAIRLFIQPKVRRQPSRLDVRAVSLVR